MDEKEIRAWTGAKEDQHKHVLGQMRVQEVDGGARLVILEVYRNAVDLEAESPAEVDICNIVYGKSFIRCNAEGCEYVGVWHLRNDTIRALGKKKEAKVYAPE
jgi:hypothetical protein